MEVEKLITTVKSYLGGRIDTLEWLNVQGEKKKVQNNSDLRNEIAEGTVS